MVNNGLVTIIVPCYNQGKYLDECLESVRAQTHAHWECIIVDDGSPDDTEVKAAAWCSKDPRFKYIKKINGGLSSARNAGITCATGDFILPLDADDKIASIYLERALDVLNTEPNVMLVYGLAEYFGDQQGEWILPPFNYKSLLHGNLIYCSSVYRKSLVKRNNTGDIYDEYIKAGFEDWEFLIRLLDNDKEVKKLQEIVFYYRIKDTSMIKDFQKKVLKKVSIHKYIIKKNKDKYIRELGLLYFLKMYIKLTLFPIYFHAKKLMN